MIHIYIYICICTSFPIVNFQRFVLHIPKKPSFPQVPLTPTETQVLHHIQWTLRTTHGEDGGLIASGGGKYPGEDGNHRDFFWGKEREKKREKDTINTGRVKVKVNIYIIYLYPSCNY